MDKAMRNAVATQFTQHIALLLGLFLSTVGVAEAEMGKERLKNENSYEQETRQRPSEKEPKAIVFVYRNPEYYGKLLKPVLYCDGIQLAKIANGRYFIVKLDPGPHVFRSKGKKSVIEIDLVGGKTYYILVVMKDFGRTKLFLTHSVVAAQAIGILEPLQAKYVLEPEMLLDPNDPSLGEVKGGSIVPGESLGIPLLQGDTENQIFSIDQAQFPGCDTRRIVNTEVKEVSKDSEYVSGRRVAGNWKERWYMDRCGEIIPYEVRYVPDGKGGTYIHTEIVEASEGMEANPTGVNAALLRAAERGDTDRIKELLDNGANIGTKEERGFTPMMLASFNGHLDAVKLFFKNGSDINAKGKHSLTALYLAARLGHEDVAHFLIDKGADIHAKVDGSNLTPLHMAARGGYIAIAEKLFFKKAKINAPDDNGDTPLSYAAQRGHVEMVELLITNGADVNAESIVGVTPLTAAIMEGHTDVMNLLKRHHAKKGCAVFARLLYNAAHLGKVNTVAKLIQMGTDPNVLPENSRGWTSLMIAAAEGHESTVSLLLGAGAHVNAKNNQGRTALMFASSYGYDAIVQNLLNHQADPNIVPTDDLRWTALIAAANKGHTKTVQILLDSGADASLKDKMGRTAHSLAEGEGHRKTARRLKKAGDQE